MAAESQASLAARLDARVKLVAAAAFVALAAGAAAPRVPLLVLASAAVCAVGASCGRSVLAKSARAAALVFALSALVGWFSRDGGAGALLLARQVALRVFASVAVLSLLVAVTPSWALCAALRGLRVPAALVEVLALSQRYVAVLGAAARTTWEAQTLRLGYGAPRRAAASAGELAGLALLRAFAQAEATAEAAAARGGGFEGLARPPPLSARDLAAAAAFAALWLALAAAGVWR